jgi:hypothetical protein
LARIKPVEVCGVVAGMGAGPLVGEVDCVERRRQGLAWSRITTLETREERNQNTWRVRRRVRTSGDTTPCRMTGVTLHSHVHYTELGAGPLVGEVDCVERRLQGLAGGARLGCLDELDPPALVPARAGFCLSWMGLAPGFDCHGWASRRCSGVHPLLCLLAGTRAEG